MSCSNAPTSSRSGRDTSRVCRAAWAAVSSRCRSTVNRCTGLYWALKRTASHSGISRVIRPARSSASRTGTAARAGAEQRDELVAHGQRPRLGHRRRLGREPFERERAQRQVVRRPRPARRAAAAPGPTRGPRRAPARPRRPVRRRPWPGRSGCRASGADPKIRHRDGRAAVVASIRRSAASRAWLIVRAASCTLRSIWSRSGVAVRAQHAEIARDAVVLLQAQDVLGCDRPGGAVRRERPAGPGTPRAPRSGSRRAGPPRAHAASGTSRRQPRESFRLGSSRNAPSPAVAQRSSDSCLSSAMRLSAPVRQASITRSRTWAVRPASPTTCRMSSRPSIALRSSLATATASSGVRTEWSRPILLSQIGYQIESASAASPSTLPSCSRTRSRSEYGAGSPRPRPPTATSATPSRAGTRSRSQRVVALGQGGPQRRHRRVRAGAITPARTCDQLPQTASAPRSPVRTRTSVSTDVTQTLPSPILPVRAASTIASTTLSASPSSPARRPAPSARGPRCTPRRGRPRCDRAAGRSPAPRSPSVPGFPSTSRAALTSSSLNGLMTAVTCFMRRHSPSNSMRCTSHRPRPDRTRTPISPWIAVSIPSSSASSLTRVFMHQSDDLSDDERPDEREDGDCSGCHDLVQHQAPAAPLAAAAVEDAVVAERVGPLRAEEADAGSFRSTRRRSGRRRRRASRRSRTCSSARSPRRRPKPAMKPMNSEPIGLTQPAHGVIATRPATAPDAAPSAVDFP